MGEGQCLWKMAVGHQEMKSRLPGTQLKAAHMSMSRHFCALPELRGKSRNVDYPSLGAPPWEGTVGMAFRGCGVHKGACEAQ